MLLDESELKNIGNAIERIQTQLKEINYCLDSDEVVLSELQVHTFLIKGIATTTRTSR